MRRAALFALAALVLAACQPGAGDAPPEPRPDPEAKAACEAEGGTYGQYGLFQEYLCRRPTPDAGQPCAKASDCTGLCLAETRSCAPVTPIFGCHAILDEDGEETVICID